ncbi:MAG TPA: DUF3048 domain-containing protein [Candidatus Eremiobacteraceae bacterium]|nr:DUF3048 domain-containing protein [Candidatus Eremiobacteraceae bacterium]
MAVDPLDGVLVDPPTLKHRVAAVMIDNYPIDARPQSGLHDAEVVYEVEAEGGITRYLALYLSATPAKIGPVRSARTYFVELSRPYDPLFAHAGENDDVWEPLKLLRESGFADMEQIVGTPEAFWRESTRDMPHNLYTSVAKLRAAAPNHGWPDSKYDRQGFSFDYLQPLKVDAATVTFWNHYEVDYRRSGTAFERSIAGVTQHDLDDPRPYRVADIVAIWIPAQVLDELGDLAMSVYGDYPAFVVRADRTVDARWIASGPDSPPQLIDGLGNPVELARGQIYIEVLPQGGSVTVGKRTVIH